METKIYIYKQICNIYIYYKLNVIQIFYSFSDFFKCFFYQTFIKTFKLHNKYIIKNNYKLNLWCITWNS